MENNPKPAKAVESNGVVFQKFEVWTTSSSPKEQVAKPTAFGLGNAQSTSEAVFSTDFKHAWHNNLSPFVHYRTNPVFMVPSHLTLTQLSKILLESNVTFKPRVVSITGPNDTLESLYTQMLANDRVRESANGIIDLEYDINQLLNV